MELHVVSIFGWPHDIPCPKNFSGGRLWANRALGFTCQGAVDPWCQRCRWLQIHIHIHTYTHICIYHYTPLKVRFSHRFSTDCGTDHATFSSALALWQLIAVIATGFIEIWGDIRPISQHSTDFNSKLHQVPVKVTGYLGAAACEHGEVMRRRGHPSSNGLNLSWWFRKLRIQGGQTNKNISQSAYKYHFSEVFEWVQPWFQPSLHAASPGLAIFPFSRVHVPATPKGRARVRPWPFLTHFGAVNWSRVSGQLDTVNPN